MDKKKFTILGETHSGKTCYLLAMYTKLNAGIKGYSIVTQDTTLNSTLMMSFRQLLDGSSSQNRFPEATDQNQKYLFNLKYGTSRC